MTINAGIVDEYVNAAKARKRVCGERLAIAFDGLNPDYSGAESRRRNARFMPTASGYGLLTFLRQPSSLWCLSVLRQPKGPCLY